MYQNYGYCDRSRKFSTPGHLGDTQLQVPDAVMGNENAQQYMCYQQPTFDQTNFVTNSSDAVVQENWTEDYNGEMHRSRCMFSNDQHHYSEPYHNGCSNNSLASSSGYYSTGHSNVYSMPSANGVGYFSSDSPIDCSYNASSRRPVEYEDKQAGQLQEEISKNKGKEKYRVVYTEFQKKELEREFRDSQYINIQTKATLAGKLGLTPRQIKIWFQNRRAKERKMLKKREQETKRESAEHITSMSSSMLQPAPSNVCSVDLFPVVLGNPAFPQITYHHPIKDDMQS